LIRGDTYKGRSKSFDVSAVPKTSNLLVYIGWAFYHEAGLGSTIAYVDRLRQLHRQLVEEVDILKREELLERMLFVIEAHSRLQRLDAEAKRKAAGPSQPVQDILIVRDSSQNRGQRETKSNETL
jgi:hypothetical protein